MRFSILSLFPEYFESPFATSMIKRALDQGIIEIDLVNIRTFATGKHKRVDERPFGGGPGMILKPEPVIKAIRSVRTPGCKVIYLSPQGPKLTAQSAEEFALKEDHLIFLCGHYETLDERILQAEVDQELSIGDYVITCGCPAAIVVVDAISRFVPGVVGHPDAVSQDSFSSGVIFDPPQYTQPIEFEGMRVPEVLRSGNHKKIETWRQEKALEKAQRIRPDLFD